MGEITIRYPQGTGGLIEYSAMASDHSGVPFHSKKAVMLADPVASPIVKPVVTGFTPPARFASLASAANTYLPLPFGRISIISFVPLMSPKNVNPPARFFLNG
jgi:hypothetical protein